MTHGTVILDVDGTLGVAPTFVRHFVQKLARICGFVNDGRARFGDREVNSTKSLRCPQPGIHILGKKTHIHARQMIAAT